MHVWDGECHVHAGIRPSDIARRARRPPGRRLPHPPRVRLLDVGHGVRRRRRRRPRGRAHALDRRDARLRRGARGRRARTAIVATETGMLHPLRMAAPDVDFIAANEAATLPLHEDDHAAEAARPLRDLSGEVKVAGGLAERARIPIERMVAIGVGDLGRRVRAARRLDGRSSRARPRSRSPVLASSRRGVPGTRSPGSSSWWLRDRRSGDRRRAWPLWRVVADTRSRWEPAAVAPATEPARPSSTRAPEAGRSSAPVSSRSACRRADRGRSGRLSPRRTSTASRRRWSAWTGSPPGLEGRSSRRGCPRAEAAGQGVRRHVAVTTWPCARRHR